MFSSPTTSFSLSRMYVLAFLLLSQRHNWAALGASCVNQDNEASCLGNNCYWCSIDGYVDLCLLGDDANGATKIRGISCLAPRGSGGTTGGSISVNSAATKTASTISNNAISSASTSQQQQQSSSSIRVNPVNVNRGSSISSQQNSNVNVNQGSSIRTQQSSNVKVNTSFRDPDATVVARNPSIPSQTVNWKRPVVTTSGSSTNPGSSYNPYRGGTYNIVPGGRPSGVSVASTNNVSGGYRSTKTVRENGSLDIRSCAGGWQKGTCCVRESDWTSVKFCDTTGFSGTCGSGEISCPSGRLDGALFIYGNLTLAFAIIVSSCLCCSAYTLAFF